MKLQFTVVCPRCLKIYVQPIPLPSKEGMHFSCKECGIILVRFIQDGGGTSEF